MAISDDQYKNLLARLRRVEQMLNDLAVAIDNFVTVTQVNSITTLVQTDLDDVQTRIKALESRLDSLENEPLS